MQKKQISKEKEKEKERTKNKKWQKKRRMNDASFNYLGLLLLSNIFQGSKEELFWDSVPKIANIFATEKYGIGM